MNDNEILNSKETLDNLLEKYKKENEELFTKIKDAVDSDPKWEDNTYGHEGNLLEVLLYEYLREEENSDELLKKIEDNVGKFRFGNVKPSYDHKIRIPLKVDGEEKEVSITSAAYKKHRVEEKIKFENVKYKDGDEDKFLVVLYDDGYSTDILEEGNHVKYDLPGIDLDNLDEIRDAMFSQLDIVLDREKELDEIEETDKVEKTEVKEVVEEQEIEQAEEPVEAIDGTIEETTEEDKEEEKETETESETKAEEVKNEEEITEQEESEEPVKEEAETEIEEKDEEQIQDEEQEVVEKDEDEYVPVIKEDIPEERIDVPFIPNELFKNRPEINISKLNEVKNEIAKDLRSNGIEEIEETMKPIEEIGNEEEIKEEAKNENENENDEIDSVPENVIDEYDHEEDELGIDNPMVEDHTDDESLKQIKKIVEETSKDMKKEDEDIDR